MFRKLSLFLLLCQAVLKSSKGYEPDGDSVVTDWDIGMERFEPWRATLVSVTKRRSKQNKKASSDPCLKTKRSGDRTILRRILGGELNTRNNVANPTEDIENDVILVPWVSHTPPNDNFIDGTELVFGPLKREEQRDRRTMKRGWEAVNVCGCCLTKPMSRCCNGCRAFRNNSVAGVQPSQRPRNKVPREHVTKFVQNAMCMCCDRAEVYGCCSLCERIEGLGVAGAQRTI